jgi:adenylosuccinate synthase
MMLLKYAMDAIGPIDSLALTHVDMLPHLKKLCISYDPTSPGLEEFFGDDRLLKLDHEDLEHQRRLGHALNGNTIRCNYWPINRDFVDVIEDMADIKVSILSNGPTRQDKLRQ